MILRPYQRAAIDAAWTYLRERPGNPAIVLPTGSGKTPVMATMIHEACDQWPGTRVLVLAHVRELLQQACEKIRAVWPMAPLGLYSAGLRSRRGDTDIVVAGVQSVWNKADELGSFNLVLVDECHLIPPGGDGMYRSLLADLKAINPHVRLVGLTATPYRLGTGLICGPDNLLHEVCYESNVRDLIEQGFLCRLRGKAGEQADLSGVHVRGGEYIAGELEDALADEDVVARACDEMVATLADRRSWIVFCSGVKHAAMVDAALRERHVDCATVTGETPSGERAEVVERFKAGSLRAVVNVGVFTTGFDAPNVDAVVLLRPTLSPGLYYQMVGRGLRMHPDKPDCLVLDFAGCIATHGPIDQIRAERKEKGNGEAPTKTCPKCKEIVLAGVAVCPACGFEFPRPVVKHETVAAAAAPISAPAVEHIWDVTDLSYQVWTKRGADETTPKTLCVTYFAGALRQVREWVCVEHNGFARAKAALWWSKRTDLPMPTSAADAVAVGQRGDLKEPTRIVVRVGGQYPEIARHLFETPCASCRHYDAGYCHQWDADVPDDARTAGCADHKQVMAEAAADEEPPF